MLSKVISVFLPLFNLIIAPNMHPTPNISCMQSINSASVYIMLNRIRDKEEFWVSTMIRFPWNVLYRMFFLVKQANKIRNLKIPPGRLVSAK